MFWIILSTILLATLIVIYLYFIRNNQDGQSEASPAVPEADGGATNKAQQNVFKSLYSSLVRRKSASLTNLPNLLQRRHSTVGAGFPSQVANAAKNLFRKNEMYRRQMSVGGAREPLPKPPTEYYEPLMSPEIPDRFKPLTFLRQNIRILELPNHCAINEGDIQVFIIEPNEVVVKPGDPDDTIYIVLEGCLSVYITPPDDANAKMIFVRRIDPGDSFFSALSLLDIFMENPSLLKTVTLKATKKTRMAKYSLVNFYNCFKQDPDKAAWVRLVQIICTRLLHVVMTTLHQQMGLGEQLINKRFIASERQTRLKGQSFRTQNCTRPKLKRMSTEVEQSSIEQKRSIAVEFFREQLKLTPEEAAELVKPFVKLVQLEENQSLFEEGNSDNPPALGIVIAGALKLTQESLFSDRHEDQRDEWGAFIYPRELIGGLQILTDEPSFYTIKGACRQCTVALMEKADVEHLIDRNPLTIIPIARSVLQRCSSFVRAVDFALGWVLLDSGEAVYRQGDYSEQFFVVLSGRLRSVTYKTTIEEFGKGDVLGLVEVLQKNLRTTTVLAVRYSQLARIPEGLLNFVKMQYPQVGFRLVRLLGQYYSGRVHSPLTPRTSPDPLTQRNIHTIAVFPASPTVPLVAFTCELYHALSAITRVLRLSSKFVVEKLGEDVLERRADFRLMHWLNSQEDCFNLIIYECDYTPTNWTRRCLSQADSILIIANGCEKPPEKHLIDECLKSNQDGIRSRKELVLLWRYDVFGPKGTFEWLKGTWFSGHYHIHAPDRMFSWENKPDKNENEVLDFYEAHVFPFEVNIHGDFARLGRIISGNAIGLVLGGGGARGAAHVGVIKVLHQCGIPIDMVGGTSIGALVGGVLAVDPYDQNSLEGNIRSWFEGMGSYWKMFLDVTYSYVARFTGVNFNKLLQLLFFDQSIEDLWLPYFCITTDITESEMRVHRNGPLWRYVRASMSLAVWLPPVCDSDNHYLLDGGYVNNLPADVMRSFGARTVIAVDVSSADEKDFHNYGDSISGVWAFFRTLDPMPYADKLRVMTGQEIQDRLAYVSSVRQLLTVKQAPYCNYLRPPIDAYQTRDFGKFETIKEVGYRYAIDAVPNLIKSNVQLKTLVTHSKARSKFRSISRPDSRSLLQNSFTDMAAQLSRIPPKNSQSLDNVDKILDEEDEGEDSNSEELIEAQTGGDVRPPSTSPLPVPVRFRQRTNDDDDDDDVFEATVKATITIAAIDEK